MKKIEAFLLSLYLAIAVLQLAGCASVPKIETKSSDIKNIAEDYFEESLKLHPLFATSIGDHRYDDQLTINITKDARDKEDQLNRSTLAKIKMLGGCSAQKNEQDRLTCEVMVRELTVDLELSKVDLDDWMPFNQFDSFFADFAELSTGSSYISFNSVKDYQNFLKRAERVPDYINVMIQNMKEGVSKNITTPQVLVDKALKQFKDILVPNYKESVFYKPILNFPKSFSTQERAELTTKYDDLIQYKIYPAYQKLESYVRKEYRPKARLSHGVGALKGGKDFYRALVKINTTTDLTPDQIMKLGLSEVKRIRGEFEKVKMELGFKGNLKAFLTSFKKEGSAKLYPYKTAEEVLNGYRSIYARVKAQVHNHFRLMPKAPFEIREVEKFKAESASEAYQNGTPDGSRPGIFWVPIPHPEKYGAKDMESLFLHEAIPGHHFQISIQQELNDIPRYRRFGGNNAYVEGWALYCEGLGKDLGFYTDPYQWIGRLGGEMHRAIRLVVDTGIHWKGWSRERAIQYSKDNEPGDDAGIVSEVERYMAIPGQALSYKLGELKILELKNRAKEKLGARYDDRNFHDEILKDGALPLSVLEEKINLWIKKEAKL